MKIFRKARYKLVGNNKIGKYLKYGLGEILLVVIGILIALQVNEWNAERNKNKAAEAILIQLKADLVQSQIELEEIMEFSLVRAQASAMITRVFWTTEIPNDSILGQFRLPCSNRIYSPVLGTARSLINTRNIDLLKSPALKSAIISYVEKVDYNLKDIGRYEETYYRKGIDLILERMPTSFQTVEYHNQSLERNKGNDFYKELIELDLHYLPAKIDHVPFRSDLEEIFQDEIVYLGYYKLLLGHRNMYFKYKDILLMTNELLEELNAMDLTDSSQRNI